MSNLTNHLENALLAWSMTTGPATRPSAWYVALHAGDPGEDGSANELSGAGYARVSTTFAVSGNVATSAGDVVFGPATGDWNGGAEITHASVWDAASGGNCLVKGPLAAGQIVLDGGTLTIGAGALTVTID